MNAKNYRLYLMAPLTLLGVILIWTASLTIQKFGYMDAYVAQLFLGTVIVLFGYSFAVIFWALPSRDITMTQGQLFPLIILTMTLEEAGTLRDVLTDLGALEEKEQLSEAQREEQDKIDELAVVDTVLVMDTCRRLALKLTEEIKKQK